MSLEASELDEIDMLEDSIEIERRRDGPTESIDEFLKGLENDRTIHEETNT